MNLAEGLQRSKHPHPLFSGVSDDIIDQIPKSTRVDVYLCAVEGRCALESLEALRHILHLIVIPMGVKKLQYAKAANDMA